VSDDPVLAPDEPSRFGRYSLLRQIGEGGMAVVYEGVHVELEKRVAIKVLRPEFAQNAPCVDRFVREARAASRLRHPNIVGVSDVGVARGLPFLVMDLLEGEELFQTLHREGPLSVERLAEIMLPVVSAVAAAHAEGILHRDLKPENIFLAKGRFGRVRPVLLDFGISLLVGPAPLDADGRALATKGEAIGTPDYMSPEQLTAAADLDARADQYALGVVMYECATGQHPHRADTLPELIAKILRGGAPPPSKHEPAIPAALDAAILRAIQPDRQKRHASLHDLGRVLWSLAAPLTQVMWAEEFGDPEAVVAPVSVRSLSTAPPVARPSIGDVVALGVDDLRRLAPFEDCSDEDLTTVLAHVRGVRAAKGTQIVAQGAQASSAFLLLSGEVEIVKQGPEGPLRLGRLKPGALFGQVALVDHLTRAASIVARSEVTLVQIERAEFQRLLAATIEPALRLREQIAVAGIRQLRRATRKLTNLLAGDDASADSTRKLLYVQTASSEWSLPLADEE
jgi:serine/threonine-protein kinase